MTNTYNKIRKIRNKAIPEALKLKFGCEVKYNNGEIDFDTIVSVSDDKNFISFTNEGKYQHEFVNHNDNYDKIKILGRPVNIGDTLRIIKSKSNGYGDMSIGIDNQYMYIRLYRPIEEVIEIDIAKGDNIENQSEETLLKIYNLIK